MRKIFPTSILLLSFSAMLFCFNNCSKVDFASAASTDKNTAAAVTSGDQPTADQAVANCALAKTSGRLLTKTTTVLFADTKVESGRSQVCQWDQGDNSSQQDRALRAHYDQSIKLDVPTNAVICNVQMTTDLQSFKYDDTFFFTYNNKILASNLSRATGSLRSSSVRLSDGKSVAFYDYQWVNGVRNLSFAGVNTTADDYCLGSAEGHSTCTWPLSQKAGKIDFNFDPELLINIGILNPANKQTLSFTITGDNNPDSDCYHEALNFKTSISYYVRTGPPSLR